MLPELKYNLKAVASPKLADCITLPLPAIDCSTFPETGAWNWNTILGGWLASANLNKFIVPDKYSNVLPGKAYPLLVE